MAIQILSPQLANQIAAGEVVERPASVVKELVENSLDAGATRIQIDIEKAGSKRIAIRDNGCGISKHELSLALARHATSKILTLDDLESIMSLGFRGEALASISSVSRLTLTSRTAEQSEAWQAYAEGREMEVQIRPAAHPCGTTLEVLDLFYNTPARRKFMRTEKTEFAHIDEVVRRIALARFDVDFTLTHNDKVIRQYRAASSKVQEERRLSSICGAQFLANALHLEWQHQGLNLMGWVATPNFTHQTNELQYCYVNGRMMRDRLINHAIRQAYQDNLAAEQTPAYVLYLEISPQQVDVNVHPAKHEVRFHQSRLVHDFIYQAVRGVLQTEASSQLPPDLSATKATKSLENRAAAGINYFAEPKSAAGQRNTVAIENRAISEATRTYPSFTSQQGSQWKSESYQPRVGKIYQQLMHTAEPVSAPASTTVDCRQAIAASKSFGRVLTVIKQCMAIVENEQGLAVISLVSAARYLTEKQLQPNTEPLVSQPLLIPLRLKATVEDRAVILTWEKVFTRLGIGLHSDTQHLVVKSVPLPLRSRNLQILIPKMLGYCAELDKPSEKLLASWFAGQDSGTVMEWNSSQAITLLTELERLDPKLVNNPPQHFWQPIILNSIFEILSHE